VELELGVQKIDPYGRLLVYVYLPNGEMINETQKNPPSISGIQAYIAYTLHS
jgi:hypothetical protein